MWAAISSGFHSSMGVSMTPSSWLTISRNLGMACAPWLLLAPSVARSPMDGAMPAFSTSRSGSGVGADRDGADRQGRRGLQDRADQLDLVVELAALRRGQLAQRFDGDRDGPAGAALVPHPADHAIDEHHRVVAGLASRGQRAAGRRAR